MRLYLNGANIVIRGPAQLNGAFGGVPPVRVHVGDGEVLLDDAVRFAMRPDTAGRVCDVHVWEGTVHILPSYFSLLRCAGPRKCCMR